MKKTYVDPRDIPGLDRAVLTRAIGYLRPYASRAARVFAAIAISSLLTLVPALVVKRIVDVAIPERDLAALAWLSIAMVAGPLLAGLITVFQRHLATSIGEAVMLDLRMALMNRFHEHSLGWFARLKPGEAVSRVLNDVQGIGSAVSGTLVDLLDSVLALATTFLLIAALDLRLAVIAAALLPLFVLPTKSVGGRRRLLKREAQVRAAELTGLVAETLSVSGTTLRKTFAAEPIEIARFEGTARELMALNLKQSLLGRWFRMLLALLEATGPALVFGVGGYLVIEGEVKLGTIVAFVALLRRLYAPASSLASVRVEVLSSYALFDRVFQILDAPIEIETKPGAKIPPSAKGRIQFQHVSFSYPGREPALEDIDLEIPDGSLVSLVGHSGAGKSTLAALVARLYDPTDGVVLLDGCDLRELDLDFLRAQIAIVTQDTYLFHGTIADNLRYGKRDATKEEIEQAASIACIHEVIAPLPEGYETVVGERGHRFSGGERQRLAIARAVLRDPRILIMDEATSAIDPACEEEVWARLSAFLASRTAIVIAQRPPPAIRLARTVVALERGRIASISREDPARIAVR
jgi:ATP-binding cassette, subfamily B, bacterial